MTASGPKLGGVGFLVVLSGAIICVIVAGALLTVMRKGEPPSPREQDASTDVYACLDKLTAQIKPTSMDIKAADEFANHCVELVYNSYAIADYNVRRRAFEEQYEEQKYILWLVITLTLSGVALTGLQLASAYNLSTTKGIDLQGGGDLTLERGKLAIKSAVSGLLMLSLSFGFFLTYMAWVYPIAVTDSVKKKAMLNMGTAHSANGPERPSVTQPTLPYAPSPPPNPSQSAQYPSSSTSVE
jgi:hypothetical protein